MSINAVIISCTTLDISCTTPGEKGTEDHEQNASASADHVCGLVDEDNQRVFLFRECLVE